MVAQAGVRLSAPWIEDGVVWWLEGRAAEGGRVVLVRQDPDGDEVDVVPAGFNVRTSVHEYGGGAYCVHAASRSARSSTTSASTASIRAPSRCPSRPPCEGRRHRYADGRVTSDGRLWIGVRERHAESDRSVDVVNELVVLPTDGSAEPRVIAGGRDFYSNPRISPDGTRLCFLAWNLPWMPWDGCELHVADLAPNGDLSDIEHVAGADGSESIWQPEWSPAGDLVFASDRSGWWNLERIRDGQRTVLHAAAAEFGYPGMDRSERARTRSSATAGSSARTTRAGSRTSRCSIPRPASLERLEPALDSPRARCCAEGMRAVIVAGSTTSPSAVVLVDVDVRCDPRRSVRASRSRWRRSTARFRRASSSRPRAG